MTPGLEHLCRSLGYRFNSEDYLLLALTHRSCGNQNNERLEFLGDAILSFVIAEALYQRCPSEDEGRLSRQRSSLVKGDTLAELARELNVGPQLRLGPGELKSGGQQRSSILADSFEALIGAIYLDSDQQTVKGIILKLFDSRLQQAEKKKVLKDPKTLLQEYLQSKQIALPVYEVFEVYGEPHDQTFLVSCSIDGFDTLITAKGGSRRKAEQAAATEALELLNVG